MCTQNILTQVGDSLRDKEMMKRETISRFLPVFEVPFGLESWSGELGIGLEVRGYKIY